MIGRSSRTMDTHKSKLICHDKFLTKETLAFKLSTTNYFDLKDVTGVVNMLREKGIIPPA